MVTWRGRGGEAVEIVEPMMAMARRTSTMAGRAVRREVKALGAPPAVAHGLRRWGDGDGDDPGLSARMVGGKVAVEEGLGAVRCERAGAVGPDDEFVARADVLAWECAADLAIEEGLQVFRDRVEGGDGASHGGVEGVLAGRPSDFHLIHFARLPRGASRAQFSTK